MKKQKNLKNRTVGFYICRVSEVAVMSQVVLVLTRRNDEQKEIMGYFKELHIKYLDEPYISMMCFQ